MKIGLSLISQIEPMIKEIMEIKKPQIHGKHELIEAHEKHYAIYREFFETEHDANHFVKFVTRAYAMKKDQMPPIHILIVLFKALLPIMTPKKLIGTQSHGKPEIKKTEDGKFCVILKEAFTKKDDAQSHLDEATRIISMRL